MKKGIIIHKSGKRKRAIARATLKPGKGVIRFNSILLDNLTPRLAKLRLMEPVILAGDVIEGVNVSIKVIGGGIMAQAEAGAIALSRALVEFVNKETFKKKFIEYDRNLLVSDARFKETRKPNDSKARAKRQKSYR